MSLQDRIQEELKAAMRAKDTDRLSTLRMLKSSIGYVLIEENKDTLDDSSMISLLQKEAKKRRDSIEQFDKGGRAELADKERAELNVIEEFLPQPLAPEELEALVKQAIEETGATSRKEMGAVIKAVQAKAAGRADGKTISGIVAKMLS